MTPDQTAGNKELLQEFLGNIPIVKNLGLDTAAPCFLDLRDTFGDLKLVESPAADDELAVWVRFSTRGDFEKYGYDDVRDFVIDGRSRMPRYSFRYVNPGIRIFDDIDPSNCRRYTYGVGEVRYPFADVAEIPFTVTRQVVEVFDLIPDPQKIILAKRTNVLVNRLICHTPADSDIFAPLSLVSSSVFERATSGPNSNLLGPAGELWVEKRRTFPFKKEKMVYERSNSGVLERKDKRVFVFSDTYKFAALVNDTDEIFFPSDS